MAVGVVMLTKRGRYSLLIATICLLVSQSFLGLLTTTWSIYVCIAVSPTLYSEKSEIMFVFTMTGMYGTHILFHNLTGVKICHQCHSKASKKSTRYFLFVWILAGCNTMLNIVILSVMAVKISKHIIRAIRQSMERGIRDYLRDPGWKYTIDTMQARLKCCGVNGYGDWYKFTWLDKEHIRTEDKLVQQMQASKESLQLPVVPWSCCRTDFPMQCFHDPLQQLESVHIWKEQPSVVLESIYNQGCLSLLERPIDTALLAFTFFTVFIVLLQIVSVLILRILYTACRNAVILNNTSGAVPGWIFGRGDCGWSRGPGLEEIMQKVNPTRSISRTSTEPRSSKTSKNLQWRFPLKRAFGKKVRKVPTNTPTTTTSASRSDEEPVPVSDEEALML